MEEEIKKLYLSGLSCVEVSKKTGVGVNRVYKVVKESGINRSRTESLQKYVKYGTCVMCGRKFRMREKWNSTTSHYRKTCSPDCESALRSEVDSNAWTPERREYMSKLFTGRDMSGFNIKRGPESPIWKGGATSYIYRNIARNLGLDWVCMVCGSTENICVHHVDRDRTNNTIENLRIECKPCHTGKHARSGECGWSVYNKRKS